MRVGLKASRGGVLDAARHTKVDEEVPPALELDNQILAPTANGADLLAFELGGHELGRLGSRKPRVGDHHALEGAAGEAGLESGTNRLDLRKLGQTESPPSGDDVQHDRTPLGLLWTEAVGGGHFLEGSLGRFV